MIVQEEEHDADDINDSGLEFDKPASSLNNMAQSSKRRQS